MPCGEYSNWFFRSVTGAHLKKLYFQLTGKTKNARFPKFLRQSTHHATYRPLILTNPHAFGICFLEFGISSMTIWTKTYRHSFYSLCIHLNMHLFRERKPRQANKIKRKYNFQKLEYILFYTEKNVDLVREKKSVLFFLGSS